MSDFIADTTLRFASSNVNSNLLLYSGSLDDVRIYNRALSDAEILGLYNETQNQIPVSTPSILTNHWLINSTSTDLSIAAILKAAETGKSHYISKITINSTSAIDLTFGLGRFTLGPFYAVGSSKFITLDFSNYPIQGTVGYPIEVQGSGAGNCCILIEGYTL
jgi:hypothetical protein